MSRGSLGAPRGPGLLGRTLDLLVVTIVFAVLLSQVAGASLSFTTAVVERQHEADVADDATGLVALDPAPSVAAGTTGEFVTVTNHAGHTATVTVSLDAGSTDAGSLVSGDLASADSLSFVLPAGASRQVDLVAAEGSSRDLSFTVSASGGGLYATVPGRTVSLIGSDEDGDDDDDGDGDDDRVHAISHVSFCVAGPGPGSVTITGIEYKDGEPEPVAVTWESTVEVTTVVVKAGTDIENFPGGRTGTARVGDGTPAGSDQSAAQSCPTGEHRLVKFEWDGSEFVAEDDE